MKRDEQNRMEEVDAAWAQLQLRLAHTQPGEGWNRDRQTAGSSAPAADQLHAEGSALTGAGRTAAALHSGELEQSAGSEELTASVPKRIPRLAAKRAARWLLPAAAVMAFTVLFGTGFGDRVLAAMSQTFRVDTLVTLSEEDISSIRSSMEENGVSVSEFDMEQFGRMEERRMPQEVMKAEEAEAKFGQPIPAWVGENMKGAVHYLNGSQEVIFYPNTEAINKMISRLGGKSKLPDNTDGQPLTLRVPPHLSIHMENRQLTITQLPRFEAPEGVDVKASYQALLDLPVLPHHIREQLKRVDLDSGSIPIIQIERSYMTQATIGGITVLHNGNDESRHATWIQDGNIYEIWIFEPKGGLAEEGFLQNIETLIAQAGSGQ